MEDCEAQFARLMREVRGGSAEAARELYVRYADHVRRVIRHNLHVKLRPKFDSLDFLQDVWNSFFADDRLEFRSPGELVSFLQQVAHNKVVDTFRQRMQTQKHDLNRECSLDSAIAEFGEPASPDPSPSQCYSAQEAFETMRARQPRRRQPIVTMLQEGYSHSEIAERLGVSAKTVQRLVRRIRPEETV